jgi:hypothetical protein
MSGELLTGYSEPGMKARERSVITMNESVEVRNICDWVRFQDRKDGGGTPIILIPACEDAARIYMLCRNQTVNIFNGEQDIPVDLNHLAVWAALDHAYDGPDDYESGSTRYSIAS